MEWNHTNQRFYPGSPVTREYVQRKESIDEHSETVCDFINGGEHLETERGSEGRDPCCYQIQGYQAKCNRQYLS